LQQAVDLADRMIELFYDKENGAFWQGTGDGDLQIRMKEDYDGAMPSANSVAALALLKLHKITEKKIYRERAGATLQLFAVNLERGGRGVPYLMMALDFYLHEPYRVVVAGKPGDSEFQKILHAVHNQYQPNRVILGNHGPVEKFAKKQTPDEDGALVYVCSGTACQLPTRDSKEIQSHLKIAPPTSMNFPSGNAKKPEIQPGQTNPPSDAPNKSGPKSSEDSKRGFSLPNVLLIIALLVIVVGAFTLSLNKKNTLPEQDLPKSE
jgi:hypothetical protein